MTFEDNTNRDSAAESAYTSTHTAMVAATLSLIARSFDVEAADREIRAFVRRELEAAYRAGVASLTVKPGDNPFSSVVVGTRGGAPSLRDVVQAYWNRYGSGGSLREHAFLLSDGTDARVQFGPRSDAEELAIVRAQMGIEDLRAELNDAIEALRAVDRLQGNAKALIDRHNAKQGRR